jgi:hypothetical protein
MVRQNPQGFGGASRFKLTRGSISNRCLKIRATFKGLVKTFCIQCGAHGGSWVGKPFVRGLFGKNLSLRDANLQRVRQLKPRPCGDVTRPPFQNSKNRLFDKVYVAVLVETLTRSGLLIRVIVDFSPRISLSNNVEEARQ